ncbi:hypothetical protein EAF04_010681 [Stromatinia cepivora]|nr:hypothetical protein EAF04_010681 [Stromatinia cepivora]
MHILVVNDDGPPSNKSSPYVHSLVKTLQAAGHTVSVVLPHTQRSWIGKAHMVGQTVKPTYFRPGTLHEDNGTTHSRPSSDNTEEWVLVDGTPASCVQIGLYHYFQDRGPVDLVVSGPNYGRNSTAVFSLSSGTIGGAMEAAVCKRKAIALSYAFFTRNHDPEIIGGASRIGVKIIEYLYNNWGEGVDLYTVNVPLVEGVEERKVLWTNMLQNYWGEGSCFEEVDGKDEDADEEEEKIREKEGQQGEGEEKKVAGHTHKHFKWAPRFTDVHKSVEEAEPGNDGWAVKEGFTSVTPLKANFMHATAPTQGELKLPSSDPIPSISNLSLQEQTKSTNPHFYAYIDYEDSYVQPLILSALEQFPQSSCTLISSSSDLPTPESPYLHISSYETIPFDEITSKPTTSLTNAYVIRKALIRKHYLSETSHIWCVKNPESILKTNIKRAEHFEVDYAEFLDDAIVECWDLKESFARNEKVDEEGGKAEDREWWILKPGMSDRGQGIRLFSSYEELVAIFEGWEEDAPDSDEEDEETTKGEDEEDKDYIQTSHLRHFLAQPYIHPPLLLSPESTTIAPTNTKFHIRTYVLASGALDIYVYKPMLALFASSSYIPPWDSSTSSSGAIDLNPHLTNTCIQTSESKKNAVHLLSSLPFPASLHQKIQDQIFKLTSEIFVAAAKEMSIHFQPLPNAFEAFGLDFLVDAHGDTWLLEVNAFPDFAQSGVECKAVVEGFWREVVGMMVKGFFGVEGNGGNVEGGNLVRVGGVDLGRR